MSNVYENFKGDFIIELKKDLDFEFTKEKVDKVLLALDRVAFKYEFSVKSTELAVYEDPIPKLVRLYLAVKAVEGRSRGTIEGYERILMLFFLWVRKPPEKIVANDIRIWLYDYKQRKNIQDGTLDSYRACVCRFFKWASDNEYIKKNPAQPIQPIKCEQKTRNALSQLELETLRSACKTHRDRAMLEFLYSTGCRVSEMIAVKLSDINWDSKIVTLFGKGRKQRMSFINARCEIALKKYLSERRWAGEYLFVSERSYIGAQKPLKKEAIEKWLRLLSASAGFNKRVTPHIIRHTTATIALQNGMPIEDISKLLGHSNMATTMIYAKTSTDRVYSNHRRCVI